jgi:NADPH-dependent 7-cyano-7-deazaguanine reductase QueF
MNNKIYEDCEEKLVNKITSILVKTMNNKIYEDCEEKLVNKIASILVKTMNNKCLEVFLHNLHICYYS